MVQCVSLFDSAAGSTAKVLVGFGFNCFSFIARDQAGPVELLWSEAGFESGQKRPSGSGIPLLFPFPGRLPGMTFAWEGKDYPLESDDGRGNGIHGYVHCRPWRMLEQSENHVAAEFHASQEDPSLLDRWPADFRIQAVYRLEGNRLCSKMTISNPDDKPLPCGLGSHPYFRLPIGDGDGERCLVTLPVLREWELKDMLPTGVSLVAPPQLSSGQRFGSLQLDNVFSGLEIEDGQFRAAIDDPDHQRRVEVAFTENFTECVVYTPPHREAICIEPYTCVPGAAGRDDFATGWRILAPGESATYGLEIALVSP